MKQIPKNRLFCWILIAALCGSAAIYAQSVLGTISGQVTDSSGAVVPGAAVTAESLATGLSRSAVASDEGQYRIAHLPAGEYRLTAEMSGFKKAVEPSLSINVGQDARLDFELQVGEIAEEVVVESSMAQLELEPRRTQQSSVLTSTRSRTCPSTGASSSTSPCWHPA